MFGAGSADWLSILGIAAFAALGVGIWAYAQGQIKGEEAERDRQRKRKIEQHQASLGITSEVERKRYLREYQAAWVKYLREGGDDPEAPATGEDFQLIAQFEKEFDTRWRRKRGVPEAS